MKCVGCNRDLEVGDQYIEDTASGFIHGEANPAVDDDQNHDVYDGVLDCGHSLDDGAWLVDADELRFAQEQAA